MEFFLTKIVDYYHSNGNQIELVSSDCRQQLQSLWFDRYDF